MDSEECRAAILASAKEAAEAIADAFRPSIDRARTLERRIELYRQAQEQHLKAMQLFVKLLNKLPPPPIIIEADHHITALQSRQEALPE